MSEETTISGPNLYELNRMVMMQLPSQSDVELKRLWTIIGDWFSKDNDKYYMVMCKERSDFTMIHFTQNNNYYKALQELQELLAERGQVCYIEYNHDGDYFQIWVKTEKEAFMFVLYAADFMVIEI